MLALVICCVVLGTVTQVVLLRRRRPLADLGVEMVRWVRSPYRSFQPIESVPPNDHLSLVVQIGAWSSLVSGFVLVPGLGWALATSPLGAFAPVVAVWMALAMVHLWCARTLLCGECRGLAAVRSVALAAMAIAIPISLTCLVHLASLGEAEHDPCVPSIRTRLVASLVCIAHALLLLVAARARVLSVSRHRNMRRGIN